MVFWKKKVKLKGLKMNKNKYKKGQLVISFNGLFYQLKTKGVVYLRDKVLSEGWVMSLQLRYVKGLMEKDLIRAVKKK